MAIPNSNLGLDGSDNFLNTYIYFNVLELALTQRPVPGFLTLPCCIVAMLRRLGARRKAALSAKSLVIHDSTCWSDAK